MIERLKDFLNDGKLGNLLFGGGEDYLAIINISLAILAIVISAITFMHTRRYNSSQSQEKFAATYTKFANAEMRKARQRVARDIIPRYYEEKEFRSSVSYYSEENLDLSRGSCPTDEGKGKLSPRDDYSIPEIIEFYSYIYRAYKDDKNLLEEACNQYFYQWWRGFLLSYCLVSRRDWESRCRTFDMERRFPFNDNLEAILSLDIKAMSHAFDHEKDLYYKSLNYDKEIYPGLEDHNDTLLRYNRKK